MPAPQSWQALPTPAAVISSTSLFMQRRGNMGRQSTDAPLTRTELGILQGAAARSYRSDLAQHAAPLRSVRLAVNARHLAALLPGAYAYHAAGHGLEALVVTVPWRTTCSACGAPPKAS